MQLVFDEKAGHEPFFLNLISGISFSAHMYLRRIPISEVPDDEVEASKWMLHLFVRKDKLQTSFHKTGDFFKESGIAPCRN
jgi:lysophosphatidic acid acyltransferase / lysophosphatidylinositol acyltransferase